MRRVPTYYQDLIDIIGANPGHVIGSCACLGGFFATKALKWYNQGKDKETFDLITDWCILMKKIFGKDNFYLEMQPSANNDQLIVNKFIYAFSQQEKIPFIITTDSHYLKKSDAPIHKAFLNAQEGEREVDTFYATTYLMGTEELEAYMSNFSEDVFQEAYQNILNIKNQCEDFSFKKPLEIPSLTWKEPSTQVKPDMWFAQIPYLKTFYDSDFIGDKRLVELIVDKISLDPRLQTKEIYDEINDNLRITWVSSKVNKAHWSAYFLNLQQIIDVCWNAGTLVGPGRGSGVGFLLLYILDIIQINPLWETTRTFSWRLTVRFKGLLSMVTYL